MSRTLVQGQSHSFCLVSYAGRCKFRRIHLSGRTKRSAVRASGAGGGGSLGRVPGLRRGRLRHREHVHRGRWHDAAGGQPLGD